MSSTESTINDVAYKHLRPPTLSSSENVATMSLYMCHFRIEKKTLNNDFFDKCKIRRPEIKFHN